MFERIMKRIFSINLTTLILVIAAVIVGYMFGKSAGYRAGYKEASQAQEYTVATQEIDQTTLETVPETPIETARAALEDCVIEVIDCGQADSIFIKAPEGNVLIDAGVKKHAEEIIDVLRKNDVQKIDILIATHPHSDHIGGMREIVNHYDIDKIIMSPTGHTSKTYENLLREIQKKKLKINTAHPGDKYELGDLKLEILAPVSKYEDDLNNASVVTLVSYGDTDILMTGDAEQESEHEYAQALKNHTVEILKAPHHGSSTSSSDSLMDVIDPEVAIISCGVGNDYGHPHQETLDKYEKDNITVYRTDLSGNIIVTTNGIEYSVETEPSKHAK